MIIDLRELQTDAELSETYALSGGAAGISMALSLIDSGLDVLLLESGWFDRRARYPGFVRR